MKFVNAIAMVKTYHAPTYYQSKTPRGDGHGVAVTSDGVATASRLSAAIRSETPEAPPGGNMAAMAMAGL